MALLASSLLTLACRSSVLMSTSVGPAPPVLLGLAGAFMVSPADETPACAGWPKAVVGAPGVPAGGEPRPSRGGPDWAFRRLSRLVSAGAMGLEARAADAVGRARGT